MSEALALAVLAASLGAAVARPRRAPEWAVAGAGALLLLAAGVVHRADVRAELHGLGPTLGFLAALLVLADGCARAGLFRALGEALAARRWRSARPLLGAVFLAAAGTTAVLSLDATVVLLTPVVLVTVRRLQVPPEPHVLACAHLANSASLLLPVSNLTNLLAFAASGLSFAHFTTLMALPWLAALAVEWLVLSRVYRPQLAVPARPAAATPVPVPRLPLAVVALTLAGFGLSSALGLAPVWVAAAGAVALALGERTPPRRVLLAVQPLFLLFVLALGVIVRGAGRHGLDSAVHGLIPHGAALPALLAVAGLSALLANLVNNLPATLILLPAVSASGRGPLLAMLIGVGIGPNLTYVGSLATLLWRGVLREHGQRSDLREFTRLGLLVVPVALAAATAALWLALKV